MTTEPEEETNLFQANNHSAYQISYRESPKEVQDAIVVLAGDAYGAQAIAPETIAQVCESEQASNNFRIRMNLQGDDARWYLLRKHILIKNEHDLSFLENTLTFLKEKHIPVPALIPTKEGTLHFAHGGVIWQLYEYIPGDHYRGTGEELCAVAKGIAALHKALASFPYSAELKKRKSTLLSLSADVLASVLHEAQKRKKNNVDAIFIRHARLLSQVCDDTLSALDGACVRMQAIHGDLHPHNVICSPETVQCSIIDFDMMQYAELLRDVAFAAHRFDRQYVVWHNGGISRAREGAALFLRAYEMENPLTETEKRLLPFFIRHELLRRITTDFSRHYFEGIERFATAEELKKKLMLLQEAEYISYE